MKRFLLLCAALTLNYAVAFGEIYEITSFSQLRDHVTAQSLVLLDIDDTLLIPVQMLGCEEWFQLRRNKHLEKGLCPQDALESALAEWEAVRHCTRMELCEPDIADIVRELQTRPCKVMALTTQGLALATRTFQQLLDNGIDLRPSAPNRDDAYAVNAGHGVLYRNGIFFTSGSPKGPALFSLLQQWGWAPDKIVFINDKASHLADVETTAIEKGIPFVGLRYAFSDKRKRAFDPELAELQFARSTFQCLLSDDEARSLAQQATGM